MRELWARCRGAYRATAHLAAVIHNANCGEKDKPRTPSQCNPFDEASRKGGGGHRGRVTVSIIQDGRARNLDALASVFGAKVEA